MPSWDKNQCILIRQTVTWNERVSHCLAALLLNSFSTMWKVLWKQRLNCPKLSLRHRFTTGSRPLRQIRFASHSNWNFETIEKADCFKLSIDPIETSYMQSWSPLIFLSTQMCSSKMTLPLLRSDNFIWRYKCYHHIFTPDSFKLCSPIKY